MQWMTNTNYHYRRFTSRSFTLTLVDLVNEINERAPSHGAPLHIRMYTEISDQFTVASRATKASCS